LEFFLLAYSDAGDVSSIRLWSERRWRAALLDRTGYGCEISPAYWCDVMWRVMNLTGENRSRGTGETFALLRSLAASRQTRR